MRCIEGQELLDFLSEQSRLPEEEQLPFRAFSRRTGQFTIIRSILQNSGLQIDAKTIRFGIKVFAELRTVEVMFSFSTKVVSDFDWIELFSIQLPPHNPTRFALDAVIQIGTSSLLVGKIKDGEDCLN